MTSLAVIGMNGLPVQVTVVVPRFNVIDDTDPPVISMCPIVEAVYE